MLFAIGHIVGALLAVTVISLMMALIAGWQAERNQKRALEEVSVRLGVALDKLNDEELTPKILQYSSERFSNELLKNRISDLCGLVRTMWDWLGLLLQIGTLLGVVWYTITESVNYAVNAWFILAIALFFNLASMLFSFACWVLTGRHPGEAKLARKSAAEFLKVRSTDAV